jgi:hypothetical protein
MLMFIALGVLGTLYYSHLMSVSSRQQQTYGVVASEATLRHGPAYNYTFVFRGKTFSGTGSPDPVRSYTIGEPIRVYFDRENPNENALAQFSKRAGQSLFVAIVPLLLVTLLALYVLYHWWRTTGGGRAPDGLAGEPSSSTN